MPNGWVSVDYGDKRMYHLIPEKNYTYKVNLPKSVEEGAEVLDKARIMFFKDDWTRIDLE